MATKRYINLIIVISIILVAAFYSSLGFSREQSLFDEQVIHEEHQIKENFHKEVAKREKIYRDFLHETAANPLLEKSMVRQDPTQLYQFLSDELENLRRSLPDTKALEIYDADGYRTAPLTHKAGSAPLTPNGFLDKKLSGFTYLDGVFRYCVTHPLGNRHVLVVSVDAVHVSRSVDEILGSSSVFVLTQNDPSELTLQTGKGEEYLFVAASRFPFIQKIRDRTVHLTDNEQVDLNDRTFTIHTEQQITDINGHIVGRAIFFVDKTAYSEKFRNYILIALGVTVVFLSLIYLLSNFFLARIINSINEKQLAIEELNRELAKKNDDQSRELDKNLSLLNSYKRAVDGSNIVSKTTPKGIITYVNDEFIRVSGYRADELIGHPHNIIRHPDMPKEAFEELWKTIKAKKTWRGLVKNRKKDGSSYIVDTTIVPILNEVNEIEEYIAIRHDVTDLIRQREQLLEIKTDELTGLGNKSALKEMLSSTDENLLAILNIDNYKEIKDFFGVDVTDNVVKTVAGRMSDYFNLKGFGLFKINADQFAAMNPNATCKESFIEEIRDFIQKVTQKSVVENGNEIFIDMTVGIACNKDNNIIFRQADLALKEAKNKHKDLYLYDENIELLKQYEHNLLWTSKLKKAITSNRLKTFFQPIVNNETGRFEKYESLIRMIDEDGKVISPFFFLNTAKQSKLYPYITQTVITQSVQAFSDTDREFSINITAEDVENPDTVAHLERELTTHHVASRCVIEITESEEIKDYQHVISFIDHFKSLGCKIAIDDFGSGYSNFSYIADLGADYIKIDGSLIKNIDNDPTSELIVRTILTFAKNMGIKTVAEFVASESVYKKIKELGVDYSQGFYFSEPREEVVKEA